ncbi:glycoside hydrolase family protein [Paenibacillus sp. strain BS8-2]
MKLHAVTSPILLQGDDKRAYRDPCAVYHDGIWYLYFTLVETEPDGGVYLYAAASESMDLKQWSEPRLLTRRDQGLNFSSPGNVVYHGGKWRMCLQTYPRPNGEKYGNADCRLWTMESADLRHWSEPELLLVKGRETDVGEMGRMIDPYWVENVGSPGEWYCFYKQNGVSFSRSYDLKEWTYGGSREAGENVCVIRHEGEYVMFHSPENGIGVMRSTDLSEWREDEWLITLGQKDWEWAKGRITAGFVIDLRHVEDIEAFVMFFHGSGPQDESVLFDTHASIGIAWSKDLLNWEWPK